MLLYNCTWIGFSYILLMLCISTTLKLLCKLGQLIYGCVLCISDVTSTWYIWILNQNETGDENCG